MTQALDDITASLSPTQSEAVNWQDGAALVLAGPGSGKTRVLTARIARLLEQSRGKRFRVLALTFTTKAAREMRERVEALVPDLAERADVMTFHSFCAQILQQHGSHIGVKSDFGIYDQLADRKALLADALRASASHGAAVGARDIGLLETIEKFRQQLIIPERTAQRFKDAARGAHVALVYKIYEDALKAANVLDFDGLILEASRLVYKTPVIADRLRRTYPFWMIDEFQDTTPAQYRFLSYLAGASHKNVFAVGDDDQIIYQWAGASYRQIVQFRNDYKPVLMQLIENHRCPRDVVAAANRLVHHNLERTDNKTPITAAKTDASPTITLKVFADDAAERSGVADDILANGAASWGQTVVLARNKMLLEGMLVELRARQVTASIAQRRDRFQSPHMVWLQAAIDQVVRPADKQVFRQMFAAAEQLVVTGLDGDLLMAEANALGIGPTELWARRARESTDVVVQELGATVQSLGESRRGWRPVVRRLTNLFETWATRDGVVSDDVAEDLAAWEQCLRDLRGEKGAEPELSDVIQGLALRSKEPPRAPGTVTLMTIHGAKGLEFDRVYVIGLAESILPSWQSQNSGDTSVAMEEERRSCFVAVTRTREMLSLSYAQRYRGRQSEPSRFIAEMGL